MNRNPCSGCGLRSCEGECFLQCEADFEPEEVAAPRVKQHVRSAEYAAWCAEVDAARTTVTHQRSSVEARCGMTRKQGASVPDQALVQAPSPTVSALTGFDPSRGADNILPLLTPTQAAFILRMEPSVLDQEISRFDWDNIDCKVDNPDVDGWPYWHWFGGMRLHWPAGRANENPEITFRFNPDGLSVREHLCSHGFAA